MSLGQFLERPVERADRVGRRKDRQRETVALFLEFPQRILAAGKDRGRGSFGIAQRIRNAVRRQRIAEEAGIADQHPAGAMRLPKPAGRTPECLEASDAIGNRLHSKSGCQRIQDELASDDKIGTEFGIETARA